MQYQFYSIKKYPSWCTCCIEPKYLTNRFDAYYHIKRKTMAPKKLKSKKSSPSAAGSSSNEQTPQSSGNKRSAPNSASKELDLFYANCEPGGIIYDALIDKDLGADYFNKTIVSNLKKLSKEDRIGLFDDFMGKSTKWKKEKSTIEEHYESVYAEQVNSDWKGYVADFKKRALRNNIPGDYVESDQVLIDEKGKLESIIEVIEKEQLIREKVEKEKLWEVVIKQILETDLKNYPHYSITNTHQSSSSSSSSSSSNIRLMGLALTREVSEGDGAPDAAAQGEDIDDN